MRVNALPMLMPEAATNFYDFLEPGKDKIGLARKVGDMEPIAESHAMNETTHQEFRRCVLRPDLPHVFGTAFWSEFVGHTAKSSGRSEMSFNRFPFTIMLRDSSESESPNSFTVSRNSGRAKW